ncbi:glycosyltransferase family 1 protein [Methanocella sp. CWC-04]|uniref:Glycosyltransferase family 1 protein n=1 Tax=Methanooceanicella nereidis TaxID=2052831 RepID=A0AAP2W773_9EURY|nr:glycosyltransferase family 4 protein [Methanocella sp. CWC-04]MCD1296097.1 glycosyltransferase family 1 protein [Methanocella sp. CWC-04]
MRIAFVTDVVYPYVKGGAEKRIYEMSRRLAASGNEVHVFSAKWWEGPSVMVKDGVTYHGVSRARSLYAGDRRSIFEAVLFGASLVIPLLKEKFDVIDCNQHPYFSIFSCKLASVIKGGKFFVTWHELWGDYWYEYMGFAGFFGKTVEKITSLLPDRIISVSKKTASDLIASGISENKVITVPNGISYKSIKDISPSNDGHDVVFAGRLIKDKHVRDLLGACSVAKETIPDLKALIIGDGPEKDLLQDMTVELDLQDNVKFAGRLEESSLIASIKSSRVFVLPSTREGFSITTLEALACGTPVITVRGKKNYATELIEDGVTGLIVDLDYNSICDGILQLLKDENRRKTMSEKCVVSVKDYDWDMLASKLLKTYREF